MAQAKPIPLTFSPASFVLVPKSPLRVLARSGKWIRGAQRPAEKTLWLLFRRFRSRRLCFFCGRTPRSLHDRPRCSCTTLPVASQAQRNWRQRQLQGEPLVSSASRRCEGSFQQASRIALTKSGRCNNSSGDDFARHLGLIGVAQLFAGSIEGFAHRCNRLSVERSWSHE
jgi:hypothetical protein